MRAFSETFFPARPLRRFVPGFLLLLYGLLLAGCPTVRLVSDYDEEIDRGVTAFQRQIEHHLAGLERVIGTPAADYGRYTEFYDDVKIDLTLLRSRAALAPHNEITVQQFDRLLRQVALLEQLHRAGLAANDLPPVHTAFSVSCTAIIKFELAKKRGEQTPSS
jgi:hypothetical protein